MERVVHKILCTVILKIVNYPLESERETVSEQFQGSWRLGTAQALHAQYKYVSSVDIRHLGTPYERVPRFLSTRELMVGNLRDSEAARYVLSGTTDRLQDGRPVSVMHYIGRYAPFIFFLGLSLDGLPS